jgi:hypothetical protein
VSIISRTVVLLGLGHTINVIVVTKTNLVLRESLDDTQHHPLPWDIELVIDESVDNHEEEPEVQVWIVVTHVDLIC